MSKIALTLECSPVNGKQISFFAPCNSNDSEALVLNGIEYQIVDSDGVGVAGINGVWDSGALVSVIVDTNSHKAYIQNPSFTSELVGAYSKTQVLSDDTKTRFGLDTSALPTEVFSMLAPYTQHWWWMRSIKPVTYYEEKVQWVSNTRYLYFYPDIGDIYYSNEVNIDQNTGEVSLVDPVLIESLSSDMIYYTLAGKYVQSTNGGIKVDYGDDPAGVFLIDYEPNHVYTTYNPPGRKVTMYAFVSASSYVVDEGEYLFKHSPDRNAYPDSGSDENFEYKYIGIPLDNAVVALTDDDMAAVIREGVDSV